MGSHGTPRASAARGPAPRPSHEAHGSPRKTRGDGQLQPAVGEAPAGHESCEWHESPKNPAAAEHDASLMPDGAAPRCWHLAAQTASHGVPQNQHHLAGQHHVLVECNIASPGQAAALSHRGPGALGASSV